MNKVQNKGRFRVTVAYLLLLTIMPCFFVKTIHVHKELLCVSHSEQYHHSSSDCAICSFTLSLFTQIEIFEYYYQPIGHLIEYLDPKEEDTVVFLFFLSLRAPPFSPVL